MLTLSFTIAKLVELKLLKAWEPTGSRMLKRNFYYSQRWATAVRALAGKEGSHSARWWDEPADSASAEPEPDVPEIDLVAMDLSDRGRVCGLVETFVIGRPLEQLVRKIGFGMDPPFERMRSTRQAVVEMKTEQTRTFGLVATGTYIAHILNSANNTHANKELYCSYGDEVLAFSQRLFDLEIDTFI